MYCICKVYEEGACGRDLKKKYGRKPHKNDLKKIAEPFNTEKYLCIIKSTPLSTLHPLNIRLKI